MSEKISNFEIIDGESHNFSLGSSGINENALKNPAFIYLTSLGSKFSRNGMKNALLRFAKFFGFQNLETVPWERINVASINLYKTQLLRKDEALTQSILIWLPFGALLKLLGKSASSPTTRN